MPPPGPAQDTEHSPHGGETSHIWIALLGDGDCTVVHLESGARLKTSKPRTFGGSGASFSSTDLLAAALGTCIATDLEPIARRHGIDLAQVRIQARRTLAGRPSRVRALHVHVELPATTPDALVPRFERAAGHCLVHRCLDPRLQVTVAVIRAGSNRTTEP